MYDWVTAVSIIHSGQDNLPFRHHPGLPHPSAPPRGVRVRVGTLREADQVDVRAMGDVEAARAELGRAHEIAAARFGADDRRTKRIAEVLESVQQHVVAAA